MTNAPRPRDFHLRWPTLKLPLRPDPAVAAQLNAHLPPPEAGTTLLLGVTPELARLERNIIAVDWSAAMIATAWPGDTAERRVILGDWMDMPLADDSCIAAMSDGAFTMLDWHDQAPVLMRQLARVIAPGGRVAIRCFASPDPVPDVDAVCALAMAGTLGFHEFKLMFNMAVAREGNGGENAISVSSATLFCRFQQMFADREMLSRATGWSVETIAEIDAYQHSTYVHCYPKRQELEGMAARHWPGSVHFVETAGYSGAELCPIFIMDRS